jgi:nucleotide-binding universal stress UspA family protein
VHPVPDTRIPSWVGADSRAYTGARVQEARRQLDELCGALGEDLSAECRVVVGDPAETVAALAAKERADLLILTLRKSPGLLRGRTRGTAYRILCAARRPVLAWPAQASTRLRRRR